jgi:hypothetical protein
MRKRRKIKNKIEIKKEEKSKLKKSSKNISG